eukprot:401003-Pelagomonas_calceolata.AAC.5
MTANALFWKSSLSTSRMYAVLTEETVRQVLLGNCPLNDGQYTSLKGQDIADLVKVAGAVTTSVMLNLGRSHSLQAPPCCFRELLHVPLKHPLLNATFDVHMHASCH